MKVKLIGGPFDGAIVDVETNRGIPQRELVMHDCYSSSKLIAADFSLPEKSESNLHLYTLENVYKKDRVHDYEYHYQGR